eukprot:GEMP01049394.1.p1 GENE.GEMP01049394.1~~GEMP01049394.1.p1  ORF type:complete len:144 (+),score=37.26 GEMP01049394.1:335-766(+)
MGMDLTQLVQEQGCSELEPISAVEVDVPAGHFQGNWEMHFFALRVTEEVFRRAEAQVLQSQHYGSEVWGVVRAPILTDSSLPDWLLQTFPLFLKNSFQGVAVQQLFDLVATRFCPEETNEADWRAKIEQVFREASLDNILFSQ